MRALRESAMRAAPFLILLSLLAAGCLEPAKSPDVTVTTEPSDASTGPRGDDAYWMVWVHGNVTRELVAGREGALAVCSVAYDHGVEPATRTLRHEPARHAIDTETVQVVVAFDLWERWSSCPATYTLHVDEANVTERMGRYGNLTLEVQDDGTLVAQGQRIPLGERARFTHETTEQDDGATWRITTEFVAENLGAWPRDRIQAG